MNDPSLAFGVGVVMGILFSVFFLWPALRLRDDKKDD